MKQIVIILLIFATNIFAQKISFRPLLNQPNLTTTQHFDIYWGDEYLQNNYWNDGTYINILKEESENIYNSFIEKGYTLPDKIIIYVINTGLSAVDEYYYLNNINAYGFFTNDGEYAEIGINGDITYDRYYKRGFKEQIQMILAHELTHAYQYHHGILMEEHTLEREKQWFFEGLSVASEKTIVDIDYYIDEYLPLLMKNINYGFFDTSEILSPYTAGFFFVYLQKKYNLSMDEILEIYIQNKEKTQFLNAVSQRVGYTTLALLSSFYNSFLFEQEIYGQQEKVQLHFSPNNTLEKEKIVFGGAYYENYTAIVQKGWQLQGAMYEMNQLSSLATENFIAWKYSSNTQEWSCHASNEVIHLICKENFQDMESIHIAEGYWLYSERELVHNVKYFSVSKSSLY